MEQYTEAFVGIDTAKNKHALAIADPGRDGEGLGGGDVPEQCLARKSRWCCVKKVRERHAVREMKEDPSEPSCRGRLQTAMSCFGQKLR